MKLSWYQKNDGQLMLEAMIAITVAVMGILGFLTLLSNSLGTSRVVSNQFIGNYLAAEGVEVVKNIIDNNVAGGGPWNQGLAVSGECFEIDYTSMAMGGTVACDAANPLRLDAVTETYSYGGGAATPFSRIVTITNVGDQITVNSKVSWEARGGSFSAVSEDHFFNWRSP